MNGINFLTKIKVASSVQFTLLILPLVYLLLGYYGLYQNKAFFTTYPDSIYIYLINGTNIAAGNFDIGHYDNPGTPVHLVGGAIIFITHLFSGTGATIYEDVFRCPEFYLSVCVNVLLWLLVVVVYLSSRFIYTHTKSSALAYLFQLLPVCSFFTLHYLLLVRLCPENIILLILVFYYAYLFVSAYKEEQNAFSDKKNVLLFSIISAVLITTKITTLPLLIFPFFFLPAVTDKIKYVLYTIVLVLLILFPVWSKFPEMYDWYTGLATRSGNYGQGQEGVKWLDLLPNFLELLKHDYFFTTGYFLLFIAIVLGAFQKKTNNKFYKFIVAAFIVCSVQLLLASKQFGYHYLIASQLIILPSLMCGYFLFFSKYNQSRFFIALFIVVASLFSFKIKNSLEITMRKNNVYESFLNSGKYKNIPKIITTGYQGACFNESGLRFGASYGGAAFYYANYLFKKEYPKSYFYDMHLSNNLINWWDIRYTPLEFFQMNSEVVIYFVGMEDAAALEVIKKITKAVEFAVIQIKLIERNVLTGESFYKIKIDVDRLNCIYSTAESIKFDFEKKSPDEMLFLSESNNKSIGGMEYLSTAISFSKSNALSIPANAYACCTTLVLERGDLIDISVKSYSNGRPIGITVSTASDPSIFNRTSESIISRDKNGWNEVRLHALIPFDCNDSKMTFCLFNWGKQRCYIDDLNITINRNVNDINPDSVFLKGKKFILKLANDAYISTEEKDTVLVLSKNKKDATVFQAIDMGNGKVALQTQTGRYVCADRSHNNLLFANRKNAYEWEMFELRKVGTGELSIKSTNEKFIGPGLKSSLLIDANSQFPVVLNYIEIVNE